MSLLLAIETSCDETAAAVLDVPFDSGEIGVRLEDGALKSDIVSSQVKLHAEYGGVVPELASREHLKNLPHVVKAALQNAGCAASDIAAVAATCGPGLKGCLLVGLSYAKAFSLSRSIPFLAVNHLEGHIFASILPFAEGGLEWPFVSLIVSGGHTMLVESPEPHRYRLLATTRDDAAGEAFDKSASLLGLPYPGGPALSRTAVGGDKTRFSFPEPLARESAEFSFSGLKTAVLRSAEKLGDSLKSVEVLRDFCAGVEHAIVRSLVTKSEHAVKKNNAQRFVLTGGVAANGVLRKELRDALGSTEVSVVVPPMKWCTDNAAMIGCAAAHRIRYFGIQDCAKMGEKALSCGARSRFPLEELS